MTPIERIAETAKEGKIPTHYKVIDNALRLRFEAKGVRQFIENLALSKETECYKTNNVMLEEVVIKDNYADTLKLRMFRFRCKKHGKKVLYSDAFYIAPMVSEETIKDVVKHEGFGYVLLDKKHKKKGA
ncbi:hypothetical protein [Sharpea azabuensis]|uniref:hypothetical protein n=1 Tax=Sharpea azabuensis TaxID=322505 RepID=UPI002E81A1AD|nr:hypothetical protein [Sharpea azabuensis]MEE3309320.1 hypothetical protein [Sharpea azabuensis]